MKRTYGKKDLEKEAEEAGFEVCRSMDGSCYTEIVLKRGGIYNMPTLSLFLGPGGWCHLMSRGTDAYKQKGMKAIEARKYIALKAPNE